MAFVGVGYGLEYSGSSLNTDNTLNVIYMKYKLNDQDTCTFEFDDITYYRDRDINGHVTYKYNTTESAKMNLWIEGTGAKNVQNIEAKVKLAEAQSTADISLQMYSDEACTTKLGSAIPLTDDYATIPDIQVTDNVYWCKISVTLKETVLEAQPSDALVFDVVFYATATAATI